MATESKGMSAIGELLVHQAILEIENYKSGKVNHFEDKNKANAITTKASDALHKKVLDPLLKEPGKLTPVIQGAKDALGIEKRGITDGVMLVQYNPRSIKIEGSTSEQNETKDENGNKIVTVPASSTVRMSFELVFHSKYPLDTSVKEQMELLLNMLYSTPEKMVKFSWANMQIRGQIVAFSGKYDMFDATGNPTSGSMNITIQTKMTVGEVSKNFKKIEKERKNKEIS